MRAQERKEDVSVVLRKGKRNAESSGQTAG